MAKVGDLMRVGIVTLAVFIAAVILGGAYVLVVNRAPVPHQPPQSTASQPVEALAAAQATAGKPFANGVRRVRNTYRNHRQQFATVSDYSGRARENRLVGLFGFVVFILLTLPKNAGGVRAFYRQMMEHSPLSAGGGATDDDNRQARKVLFFYLLFLLYQLVQFPLTLGHDNRIQFLTDFAIQTILLLTVIWTFHRLKRGLHERWRSDPARQEKMDSWLNAKLEGMNVRWRDISKLAVGVFVAGFTPTALSHLTGWLDAMTDFSQRFVGN
jgi:hypothetical protein